MRKSAAVAFLSLGALWSAGCRTSGGSATNQVPDAGAPSSGGEGGLQDAAPIADFCVGPTSLEAVKTLGVDQWQAAFKQGIASSAAIPSSDRVNVFTAGKGFPKIVGNLTIDSLANRIWDGKTMMTTEDGSTRLYNRFLQVGDDVSIDLFSAQVRVDAASKWTQQDGKPVILLDYLQSTLTDPSRGLGSINNVVVPVISAIRDEIRLVCQTTSGGERRRLYLGPTFLIPEKFVTPAGRLVAQRYEHDPVLWFALEFTEDAAP